MTVAADSTSRANNAIIREFMCSQGTADPYPLYAQLRQAGYMLPISMATADSYLVTGYLECAQVLRDRRFCGLGVNRLHQLPPQQRNSPVVERLYQSVMFLDGPAHVRLRRKIGPFLKPGRIAGKRTELQANTDRLLCRATALLASGATIDLIEELAVPLAVASLATFLDLDPDVLMTLTPSMRGSAPLLEIAVRPPKQRRAQESIRQLFDQLDAFIEHHPDNAIVAAIRGAGDATHSPYGNDMTANLSFLLAAGLDTTIGMIGLAIAILLANPRGLQAIARDPTITNIAVEELIRYEPTVQSVIRTATQPVRFGDIFVQPGQSLLLLIGSANRDARVFTNPDSFNVFRGGPASLTFGAGTHYCLGAALFREQARMLFPALLREFPGICLAGPLVYRKPGITFRGIDKLPVRLASAQACMTEASPDLYDLDSAVIGR